MPSIALFFSKFTNEDEIRRKISLALDLVIVGDNDLIDDLCHKKRLARNKVEQALYGKTSVFNEFTMERERKTAHLKSAVADSLMREKKVLYQGLISLLIPREVTHVLKVLVVDSNEARVGRAVAEGLPEREAEKLIRADDIIAYSWADFLLGKEPVDNSLYDIVVPLGSSSVDEVVSLVTENYNKIAVLETAESIRAVKDLALAAEVELALLAKGQKVDVGVKNGHVLLKVNKSTFSFSSLSDKLSEIVSSVPGVGRVEVVKGKGYRVSVYRDQQFELPPKVLLVDDEKEYVQTLSERLVARNVGTYAVFDGQQALDFIGGERPDVMVLDLKMPGMNGIEVLKHTKRTNPDIEVIILTGHGSEADRQTCMNLGAYAYLQKPTGVEELSKTIGEAYQKVVADGESA